MDKHTLAPPLRHTRAKAPMHPLAAALHVAALLWMLLSQSVHAETVTLTLPNTIPANADYRLGDADKPAILMLHGFLQTSGFHTIYQLAEALHDEGYTVLSPTLSLNIPSRKQSLACEAIHTHTVDGDHAELAAWLDWMQQQGHPSVVFIGHSTGSVTLLSYLLTHPDDQRVRKLIGISIVEGRLELDTDIQRRLEDALRVRIAAGDKRPVKQNYSYCKPITATPQSLLSYMAWTPQRILAAVARVNTPQVYIMGSVDDRLGSGWIETLRATGNPLRVIPGANHFMDGEFEFVLQDIIMAELR